jgi:hypothetical protein
MLGEATLDTQEHSPVRSIRLPIQIAALHAWEGVAPPGPIQGINDAETFGIA